MNDTLIEKLREHSAHLSKMDEDNDHGIMTTIRFEEIDLVGQACIKLVELERDLTAALAERDKEKQKRKEISEAIVKLFKYLRPCLTDECQKLVDAADAAIQECGK